MSDPMLKAWRLLQRNNEQAREVRRKRLSERHKLERRALLLELSGQGLSPAAKDERRADLERQHRKARRDLEDTFRAEQNAAIAADASISITVGSSPSFTLSPTEAIALGDERALVRWNTLVMALEDQPLVDFIRNSHLPTASRPAGIPDHEDVLAIPAMQARMANIRASRNTALQRAMGRAMFPGTRGPKPKRRDPAETAARLELRQRITRYLQRGLRECPGDTTYRAHCCELLDAELPDLTAGERKALADEIGKRGVKASQAAAIVVKKKCGISKNQARRGRVKSESRPPAARKRIVGTPVEAAEHVNARRKQGYSTRRR